MATAFNVRGENDSAHSAILYAAERTRIDALLVLAHGAGAGQTHPFMVRYAKALAARGLDVVTFNFPYVDAGRGSPDRAAILEATFRRVVSAALRLASTSPPARSGQAADDGVVKASHIFIGGKSMGGRMATHLAAAPDLWPSGVPPLSGVIVFGYPLNPPGGSRRSNDRVSHLFKLAAPTLIVQGTRDSFGGPDDIRAAIGSGSPAPPITIHAVQTGDHSLAVLKSAGRPQTEIDAEIFDTVTAWVARQRTAGGA